jgi:O-antigen/teichoic acid export membrane protein
LGTIRQTRLPLSFGGRTVVSRVGESSTVREAGKRDKQIPQSFAAAISGNIVASLVRTLAVSLIALVLPAYLTHRLPVATYSAWVLILQLAAYVSYLDLGIQTGVSKFVAEFDARGDLEAAGHHASAGLFLMIGGGTLGLGLTALLAWRVPKLFSTMPANLYGDVRVGLLLIGSSLAFGLVCAVYSAVFIGLQRYWIPTTITIINRASFAASVITVVALHGNLRAMGLAVALVNVATGLMQMIAWRKRVSHVRVSIAALRYRIVQKVARFCSVQSIWIMAMLCITGLDIIIVGHYDYGQTAYYSIATLPTNFVVLIVSAMLGPMMPASSAMSTQRSPIEMGEFLVKITRYTALLLLLTGLPLIVLGFPILRIWVGSQYAANTVGYLRVLIFANVIRNLGAPYATMTIATDRQEAATATGIAEAIVNLGSSIYLVRHVGAIGVAMGTVLGAVVSIVLHFTISMHFTYGSLAVTRAQLLARGMLRPMIIAVPSLFLAPLWWRAGAVAFSPQVLVLWSTVTLALAWYVGLNREEREQLELLIRRGARAYHKTQGSV